MLLLTGAEAAGVAVAAVRRVETAPAGGAASAAGASEAAHLLLEDIVVGRRRGSRHSRGTAHHRSGGSEANRCGGSAAEAHKRRCHFFVDRFGIKKYFLLFFLRLRDIGVR